MLRVSTKNSGITRLLKVEYPEAAVASEETLHPQWDKHVDILPGTVMVRVGEYVAPAGVTFGDVTDVANQEPYGLSGLFVAPQLGVDEVRDGGAFAVLVGGKATQVRLHAPAFDTEADWTVPTDGSRKLVYAGENGIVTTTAGSGVSGIPVGTLLAVNQDANTIRISLDTTVKA